eukprot:gnl/TRDRNA2_/TRDRNA2_83258_c0_seq1.p1 gnl/TRDRNA2_/TRDRNA2_83258_c0~~gnl/TRDRNA2_/TRDRNA2_83258_c0_seq1.p1  ORF type:complete len:382 (+),score=55.98 gnl/TRDRNA2_/TRDRNA2_83258_c0_seq1:79-1224(+)
MGDLSDRYHEVPVDEFESRPVSRGCWSKKAGITLIGGSCLVLLPILATRASFSSVEDSDPASLVSLANFNARPSMLQFRRDMNLGQASRPGLQPLMHSLPPQTRWTRMFGGSPLSTKVNAEEGEGAQNPASKWAAQFGGGKKAQTAEAEEKEAAPADESAEPAAKSAPAPAAAQDGIDFAKIGKDIQKGIVNAGQSAVRSVQDQISESANNARNDVLKQLGLTTTTQGPREVLNPGQVVFSSEDNKLGLEWFPLGFNPSTGEWITDGRVGIGLGAKKMPLNVRLCEGFRIVTKGEGQPFNFVLRDNSGDGVAWTFSFATNSWLENEAVASFRDFVPMQGGQVVSPAPTLDLESIEEFEIVYTGPETAGKSFRLVIKSIVTY